MATEEEKVEDAPSTTKKTNGSTLVSLVEENVKTEKYSIPEITGALHNKGLFYTYEKEFVDSEKGLQPETKMTQSEFDKILKEFLNKKV